MYIILSYSCRATAFIAFVRPSGRAEVLDEIALACQTAEPSKLIACIKLGVAEAPWKARIWSPAVERAKPEVPTIESSSSEKLGSLR